MTPALLVNTIHLHLHPAFEGVLVMVMVQDRMSGHHLLLLPAGAAAAPVVVAHESDGLQSALEEAHGRYSPAVKIRHYLGNNKVE